MMIMKRKLALLIFVGLVHTVTNASTTVMDVQLPFCDGKEYQCTQNSDDTPTHQSNSTFYDLDFALGVGSIVTAGAGGTFSQQSNPDGFGKYARIDHANGYWTIYAHLSGFIAQNGQQVVAGQPIAYSGNSGLSIGTGGGYHLHFGVHSGSGTGTSHPMDVYALDKDTGVQGYFRTGSSSETEFVCALPREDADVYESRPIGKTFSDYSCRALTNGSGVLCWKDNPTTCEDGDNHVRYYRNSEGANQSESNADTWRWCFSDSGQSVNIISYLDGGYGVGGAGPGTETSTTDPEAQGVLPDFITRKTWLTTPWGTEAYVYGMNESIDTHAQSENIGDGNCTGDITGHFYLSKGYKEDSHSGDDAWQRVDSTTTHCSNLNPGNTHTEMKNTVIGEWISEPGIYNIVYCIDHPQDDHNNGGDYPEKHESNNCSTEAVFEVTSNAYENAQDINLTISSLQILTANPVPSNGQMRLGMSIRNIGTETPISGIRSNYLICDGAGNNCAQVADDGTEAGELIPNRDQWEETLSSFTAPSASGKYIAKACADYQGAVAETNEGDNCRDLTFHVYASGPNLIISGVGIKQNPVYVNALPMAHG